MKLSKVYNSACGESEQFEKDYLTKLQEKYHGLDPLMPVLQTHDWVKCTEKKYLIFQYRDESGSPQFQAIIYLDYSNTFKSIARASIPFLAKVLDENQALKIYQELINCCKDHAHIISLRVRPYCFAVDSLNKNIFDFKKVGYQDTDALSVTRTVLIDVHEDLDKIMANFSLKTRARIRDKKRADCEIRVINSKELQDDCYHAMKESFNRTDGSVDNFDFDTAFRYCQNNPANMIILGLYLKSRPNDLLAYSMAFTHQKIIEYSSAGSLNDPDLRKIPFNYFLVWELIQWGKKQGGELFDFGGITSQEDGDLRAGISEFKRRVTKVEATVGHELIVVTKPFKNLLLNSISKIRQIPKSLINIFLIFILFFICSQGLRFVGESRSSAVINYEQLKNVPDIAIVGDSRSHVSLSPKIMNETLQKNQIQTKDIYNFSVDGTDVLHHSSFIINQLLQSEQTPKLIIWSINPLAFNSNRTNNRLEKLQKPDIQNLISVSAPHELILDVLTGQYFAPYRLKSTFNANYIADYSERIGIRTIPIQTKILKLQNNKADTPRVYLDLENGFNPFKVLIWKDRFDQGAKAYFADYKNLKFSPWHMNLVKKTITLAKQKNVKIVLIQLPLAPWYNNNLAILPSHLNWLNAIKKLAEENQVTFLDESKVYSNDLNFGDPGHMNYETAVDYSRLLTEKLKEEISAF